MRLNIRRAILHCDDMIFHRVGGGGGGVVIILLFGIFINLSIFIFIFRQIDDYGQMDSKFHSFTSFVQV